MNNLERRLDRLYQPSPAPWKRPVLLLVGALGFSLCSLAAYFQLTTHFTNDGIWLVIAFFGALSIASVYVALNGSDFWVALLLGRL